MLNYTNGQIKYYNLWRYHENIIRKLFDITSLHGTKTMLNKVHLYKHKSPNI